MAAAQVATRRGVRNLRRPTRGLSAWSAAEGLRLRLQRSQGFITAQTLASMRGWASAVGWMRSG